MEKLQLNGVRLHLKAMISIKEFMRLIGNINGDLPKEVLTDSDEDVHNLSTIEDVKKEIMPVFGFFIFRIL